MDFRIIAKKDKCVIDNYLKNSEYNGSEFSFLYLRGWDYFNFENMEISEYNNILFIRFKPNLGNEISEDFVYLPPLTKEENLCTAFHLINEQCDLEGIPLTVVGCPREYVSRISDKYESKHNYNLDEYLYNPSDFISLEGKKYHGKRNHLAKFEKKYGGPDGYVYRPYVDNDEVGISTLMNIWQEGRKISKYLSNEEKVIALALDNLDGVNIFANVIEYHGKIIAFSVGEITASNIGITHIEKADIEYDGAYTAIANKFASDHFRNCRFINRQEDMGIDGLRKSKMSYHPVAFAEKYVVTLA